MDAAVSWLPHTCITFAVRLMTLRKKEIILLDSSYTLVDSFLKH